MRRITLYRKCPDNRIKRSRGRVCVEYGGGEMFFFTLNTGVKKRNIMHAVVCPYYVLYSSIHLTKIHCEPK